MATTLKDLGVKIEDEQLAKAGLSELSPGYKSLTLALDAVRKNSATFVSHSVNARML